MRSTRDSDPTQLLIALPLGCPSRILCFRYYPLKKTTCEDHMVPLYADLIYITMIFKP